MIKSENRKVKGSVLLTVVAVMSILIVFLFGTLALALAANNRAHVNYSSAQTSITARTIAESVVETANRNTTDEGNMFANVIGGIDAEHPGPVPVAVSINGDGVNSLGTVESVEISYAGKKSYYDVEKSQWEVRDLLKITATVEMSGVTSQASVYALKYRIGDKDSSATGGAGFVTVAGASLECQTSIFGGAYINLPEVGNVDYIDEKSVHEDFGAIEGIDSGAPTNTFFTRNTGYVVEADLFVYNNMFVNNWDGIIFPSTSKGITVMGDMLFNANSVNTKYIYNGSADALKDIPFNQVPFIYVHDRIYTIDGKMKIGEEGQTFPLNTFCGTFDNSQGGNGGDSILYTNLYCMDSEGDSCIKGITKTGLASWSGSVITKGKDSNPKTSVNGEVCSNGNLVLDTCTINGNVRVNGNLTIKGEVTVTGYVACGGTITVEKEKGLTCSTIYNGGKQTIYYYVCTPRQEMDDEGKVYFTEPFSRVAPADGEDPTYETLNDGTYFKDGIPQEDADGNPLINPNSDKLVYTCKLNFHQIKETDIAVNNLDFTKGYKILDKNFDVDGLSQYLDDISIDPTPVYYGEVDAATVEGYKSLNDFYNNENEANVYPEYAKRTVISGVGENTDGKIIQTVQEILNMAKPYATKTLPAEYVPYYKSNNKIETNDKFEEFKTIKFDATTFDYKTVTEGANAYYINESCRINVADSITSDIIIDPKNTKLIIGIDKLIVDAGVNIYIDDSEGGSVIFYIEENGSFILEECRLLTKTYWNIIGTEKAKLSIGTPVNGVDITALVPNAYIFGAAGSVLGLGEGPEGGSGSARDVTANIMSPNISLYVGGSNPDNIEGISYNGYEVSPANKPAIIGCCNVQSTFFKNQMNIVHVPSDGGVLPEPDQIDREYWYATHYYTEF